MEEEYFIQLFFEIDPKQNILPYTDTLLKKMFTEQKISFTKVLYMCKPLEYILVLCYTDILLYRSPLSYCCRCHGLGRSSRCTTGSSPPSPWMFCHWLILYHLHTPSEPIASVSCVVHQQWCPAHSVLKRCFR